MKNTALIHDPTHDCWLKFQNPLQVFATTKLDEVLPLLQEIETAVNRDTLYAAGFVSYQAAPAFDPALSVQPDQSGFPLLWFGLYRNPEAWTPAPLPSPDLPLLWTPTLSRDDYTNVLTRIRQYLFDGETYQVNFTFRLTTPFDQTPLPLFERLIQSQGAHYSAFIDIGDFAICSASPELFFRLDGTYLESRPMKGTMKRGLTSAEDLHHAQALRDSPKNQAENVMIVDMVRNDMGRVAEKVTVDQLFKVERFPTVWQMVSTVSARTQGSLCDIFKALFPCASITGAPKPRTMAIIAREENSSRKIYTGTMGYLAPNRQAQFNVAIRTVLIDKASRMAEYGVGGGIVWDSISGDEYDECWTKAKILNETPKKFQLLETILWTPEDGCFLLDRHLNRLAESADYFDFECPLEKIRGQLTALHLTGTTRLRLLVTRTGQVTVETHPFDSDAATRPARVRLALKPVAIDNRFLYHKTTCRQAYEEAKTGVTDCDDVLLWNTAHELTESTIANIVVDLDGVLCTPPVTCGLLAGTFRAELLAQGKIRAAVVHISDLPRIRTLYLINSLRKWREAQLVRDQVP